MIETSVKGQTLLLLLLVAVTPSLVHCGVQVFNQDNRLRIEQDYGTGKVCSVG